LTDLFSKSSITVATAEAADAPEVFQSEATRGTFPAAAGRRGLGFPDGRGGDSGGGRAPEQEICEGKPGGIGDSTLFGALIAKANFFHLPLDKLGQKNGGLLFAEVTFHSGYGKVALIGEEANGNFQ